VGFVGGFQHWHGLDKLVESFAAVRRAIPNARLLLVGDGRARQALDEKIAQEKLGPAVTITGLLPQERVPEMLSAMDIAVLPYPQLPREMWFSPLKLYEYMAAGKAIVASRAGQIAEVIRHEVNGLLVEPGNVAELAQTLIDLLNDPAKREQLGFNARRQAVEQHSWNTYIDRLEEVYSSVLPSGRPYPQEQPLLS
jgi:glycosyltransferase involved in cell wall biosynthesis